MKISEVCIQRPVLAWVLTLALVLIGLVSGGRLPLQQYPNIERNYVTIETNLPGSGPEIVETQITRIIEEAVSGVEGVEHIQSVSSTEDSKVTVEFKPERGLDNAINDVRDRLSKFRDRLPEDASEPIFSKSRADERPIMTLALTSDSIEPSELADYAEQEIKKDIESLGGVARVDVVGAGKYVMNIYLNPTRLAAFNITVTEVINALKRQNVEQPAGKIISQDREYLVTTVASLEKPEEFEDVVIATKKDHLIRLRDIGRATINADDKKTRTLYNGQKGVSISIVKQSNSNPIDVSRNVRDLLEKIKETLPEGVNIQVGSDRTTFIERSLKEVYKTIFEAIFLVVCVVFFFLRSARASLIPLVTIPVSLIGTLFLMYMLNFSLNIFTLMAMVLAIGLVVDDAIVILENIYRHIEHGLSPFQAAFKGVREISFAVVAMTLTLAAVYAPISLAQGMTGKLLTEFSITLAGAVFISGFAALTLSPMMCARMLGERANTSPTWEKFKNYIPTEKWLSFIEERYDIYLRMAIEKRRLVAACALGIAFIGFVVHRSLPSELMPREDQGAIAIEGQSPQTATLEYTERYVNKIDALLNEVPEIQRRVTQIINPTYDVNIQLNTGIKRSTEDVANEIRQKLETITGVEANVKSGGGGMSGDDARSVQFVVRGNKSYRELKDIAHLMSAYLYMSGKVSGVRSEIRGDTQDYTVSILRDKVSSLNIEPKTIADTIDALIRGRKAGRFKKDNKVYDVSVEIESKARQNPNDITDLFVKTGEREPILVPLSELVSVNSRSGPIEIHRHNRMRAIAIYALLKPSYSVGDGVSLVREIAQENVPNDARVDFIDETKRYLTESHTIQLIFFLAIAFIYLVMAAQFESWRDPFIIILSVPLSLAGAVVTLGMVDGGSVNLYSNIGLVTLIGLITKHGIMMVDFANKLRASGIAMDEAIRKASIMRLRPILMTTFAMVLGALPLAFATGAGCESRRQLGWVIVGGMSIGTLFTLFVVPAFYMYLSATRVKKGASPLPDAPAAL